MCHLSIELDQSMQPVTPVLDAVEQSGFYLRSIRVVPCATSSRAAVYLSLGGGSQHDLAGLISNVERLPGILTMESVAPPV